MREVLNNYDSRRTDLGGVIGSLDFLMNALESQREEWVFRLRGHWGELEQVRAARLAGEPISSRLSEDAEREIVTKAMEEITKEVEAALA